MKGHALFVLAATAVATTALANDFRPSARFKLRNDVGLPTELPLAIPKVVSPTFGIGNNAPHPPKPTNPSGSPATGCAKISSAQAKSLAADPSATAVVPASWVEDCYKSVLLNVTLALEQIEGTKKYVQFQSTLAYLADPPEGYFEPPIDFFARLDAMAEAVKNGTFANEPEWESAMYQLWHDTHDGHFYYKLGGISAFAFISGIPLSSVSVDGQQLPKVFHSVDILHNNPHASPVKKIDGQDVKSYLLNLAQKVGFGQEPDANYQFLFTLQGNNGPRKVLSPTFQGYFSSRTLYSGNTFQITFENGTTVTGEWMATVLSDFTGVETGEDFYASFIRDPALATSYDMLNPPTTSTISSTTTASTTTTTTTSTATAIPTISGYPQPFIIHSQQIASGYFLEDSDVAILSLPSYGPNTLEQIAEFQSVVQNFIFGAKAAKKTKIIIDLSANGGGLIMQGYDTFKQFFPRIEPFGGNRMRAVEPTNLLGNILSPLDANATFNDDGYTSPWSYHHFNNISNELFQSWPALFGPIEAQGDKFTNTIRYPLDDPGFDFNYGGLVVTGYGNRSNFTDQPFDAKNIVLLYDGFCASTCALFSEMMKSQGQVKSVVVGGRPQLGPQQGVGGTKGANDIEYDESNYFLQETQIALDAIADSKEKAATAESLPGILPLFLSQAAVNFRDGLRPDNTTPLMFIYEASDCRLFYTPDMIRNVTALWKEVAAVTWGGKAACVKGSTGHPSALPHNLEPVFREFK